MMKSIENDMKRKALGIVKNVLKRIGLPDILVSGVTIVVGILDIYFKYAFLPERRHSVFLVLALGFIRSAVVVGLIFGLLKFKYRILRYTGIFIFEAFLVISSAEIWMQCNFHMALAGSWLPLLMNSSKQEVLEFLHNYSSFRSVALFILWIVLMGFVGIIASWIRAAKIQVLPIGLICIAYALNLFIGLGLRGSMRLSAASFLGMTRREYLEERALKSCREFAVPDNMTANGSVLGVIIIGESATRNHMSLYGYTRITTPAMDSIANDLVRFNHFKADAIDTRMALRYMFTEATVTNRSFIGVTLSKSCKHTDTRTAFISNQGHWSRSEALEELLFYFSERKIFIADLGLPPPVYDDAVLEPFKSIVDEYSLLPRSLIVIHLQGSHAPIDCRFPESERIFADDLCDECSKAIPPGKRRRIFNQYDNSLRFTDSIWGRILSVVKATGCPAFVLYLSDHGESPSSDGWRVATDKDCWEIPLVIWTSELYRHENPIVVTYLNQHKNDELTSVDMFNLFHRLLLISGYEKKN